MKTGKRLLLIFSNVILLISVTSNLLGQTILNGSFEVNTASSNLTNVSNANFNNTVSNVYAFGTYNTIDFYSGSFWTTWSPPYSKDQNWRVGLGSNEKTNQSDAFALKLSTPLVKGKSYSLSYYDIGRNIDPKGGKIEIGISTDNSSFGELVYTSPTANENGWTRRIVDFISPNNGQYITVRAIVGKTSYNYQWTFVDNFVLSAVTGLTENPIASYLNIYPNPCNGVLNIENNNDQFLNYDIIIYNTLGEEIWIGNMTNKMSNEIDLSNSPRGIYFVKINSSNYTYTKKINID